MRLAPTSDLVKNWSPWTPRVSRRDWLTRFGYSSGSRWLSGCLCHDLHCRTDDTALQPRRASLLRIPQLLSSHLGSEVASSFGHLSASSFVKERRRAPGVATLVMVSTLALITRSQHLLSTPALRSQHSLSTRCPLGPPRPCPLAPTLHIPPLSLSQTRPRQCYQSLSRACPDPGSGGEDVITSWMSKL